MPHTDNLSLNTTVNSLSNHALSKPGMGPSFGGPQANTIFMTLFKDSNTKLQIQN